MTQVTPPVLCSVPATSIAHLHTLFGLSAFVGALIVALHLHYTQVVKNEFYTYPSEWFPSVSATIGDWFPERSLFQVLIAMAAGPRFALVLLWFVMNHRRSPLVSRLITALGLVRTLFCGGWVYITSTDNHYWHDVFMIGYLILTIPWTLGVLSQTPLHHKALRHRKLCFGLFFGSLIPLVYFYIQHKVHRVAGALLIQAYTRYAFFEWSLVVLDVLFDAATCHDFGSLSLQIVQVERGYGRQGCMLINRKDIPYPPSYSTKSFLKVVSFLSDCYLGFVFWTLLTSLGLTIWYFPLWSMGISGFEVLLFSTISPFVLLNRKILRWTSANLPLVHFASLIGLLSYTLTPNPTPRLFCVGLGTVLTAIAWTLELSFSTSNKAVALGIGLIASSIAKFAFWGNNPVWPVMHSANGGMNKTGIIIACAACLWRSATETRQHLLIVNTWNWRGSVGLGGLLFGLHSFLCDSSTIILWVWTGYPVTGPLPVPHGALTLIIMSLGLMLGIQHPTFARSWSWYIVSCIGTAVLLSCKGWTGYCGGSVLAAYLMSVIPSFMDTMTRVSSPGKTFGFAFLLYNLFCLAHVWTVAYAFVPLGWALRERTDIVTGSMVACIGIGIGSLPVTMKYKTEPRLKTVGVFILTLLSLITAYSRLPHSPFVPYHPKEQLLTAGIWTVHFGLDNDMWASEVRMRDVIRDLELDVIGLLESDLQRIIMGFRDVTQFIAEDLGMYSDYGPGPNSHTWGAALLSKFPIVHSTHHLLPSPVGELAPAIHATLDVYGTLVDVVVAHSGQEEDVEDRRLQITELARIMAASPRPLILLSYLVTKPHEGNYMIIKNDTRMNDIEPEDWDRWCEYIWYRGLKRVAYARLHRDSITDTEVQTAKFVVGDETDTVRVREDKVPPAYRYPSMFKGQGTRGHYYNNNHVVKEPWYYA